MLVFILINTVLSFLTKDIYILSNLYYLKFDSILLFIITTLIFFIINIFDRKTYF